MKHSVRKLLVILSIALFSTGTTSSLFASDVKDPTDNSYNSRFKIFTAEHEAITRSGKTEKIQSIFKIDLETGTVWRYRQGVDQKGKPFEEFFEVPNQ